MFPKGRITIDFVQMKISKLTHNCLLTLTQCDSFSFQAIRYCSGHSLGWDWDVLEITNRAFYMTWHGQDHGG